MKISRMRPAPPSPSAAATPAALHVEVAWNLGGPPAVGRLWIEAQRTLICADLHLEKGSAYARRGQLLPPYDTRETLRRLMLDAAATQPEPGSSSSATPCTTGTRHGPHRAERRRGPGASSPAGRSLLWDRRGNHDPDGPGGLPGETADELLVHRGADPAPRTPSRGPAGRGGRASASVRPRGRRQPQRPPPLLRHRRPPPDLAGLRRLRRRPLQHPRRGRPSPTCSPGRPRWWERSGRSAGARRELALTRRECGGTRQPWSNAD